MKIFAIIFCLLLSINAFAQNSDTVFKDTSDRLIAHDALIKRNKPLIVIDGTIFTGDFNSINPKDILSTYTLENLGATNIYGEQGKNGALLIMTLKFGIEYYQRKLSSFSIAYKIYIESNQNDDSGLVYLLDGVVLEGDKSDIIKKLYKEIEKIKTVYFIDKFSQKLNLNNPKPIVVITTKK